MLKYRTRGNASPQGKQRIFLCCHPDDLEEQLEIIANELLDLYPSAALWYRDPSESRDAAVPEDDLAQMQLVVVPVTARFLRESNVARSTELPLAQELNIPVLPILDENSLAGEFNHICGDLQCLDRHAQENDPTALPYRDRLKRFLDSVLVGDDLAARVRAAFDAYVFLSYRKRDRAEAQQIMRLIHENPLCRDIAIWYDEFLVPGEGFNQAILDALDKSSVFALVVTPNLLENPNYVMTTEWPAARETGKPAIPIEALPTDPAKLAEFYAGLGESVSADDRAAVGAHLAEALRDVALEAHAGDPAHDYLIGLAYLMGIDTEVDRARALDLITAAANGGLPEACERLAAMYSNGDGVSRNYRAARDWQERLIAILEWVAKDEPTAENHIRLYNAYETLGEINQELGLPGNVQKAYLKMLDCALELRQKTDADARSLVSAACTKLGELYASDGHMDEASEYFEYAIDFDITLAEEAQDSAESASCLRRLARSCKNIGVLVEHEGNLERAAKWFSDSARFSTLLAEGEGTTADRALLVESCLNLGEFYKRQGYLDGCRPSFERALSIAEELEAENGALWSKRWLARSLLASGDLSKRDNEAQAALELFQRAVGAAEAVAETGSVEDRRLMARSYLELGKAFLDKGDPVLASANCNKAHDEYAQLVFEAGSRNVYLEYARSCSVLADAYFKRGMTGMARDAYKEALDAAQHAQFMVPDGMKETIVEPLVSIITSSLGLGKVYKAREEYSSAHALFGMAAEAAEELVQKTDAEIGRALLEKARREQEDAKAKMPAPEPERMPYRVTPPSEPDQAAISEHAVRIEEDSGPMAIAWQPATIPTDYDGAIATSALIDSYKEIAFFESHHEGHDESIFWYKRILGVLDALEKHDLYAPLFERETALEAIGSAYQAKGFLESSIAWRERCLETSKEDDDELSILITSTLLDECRKRLDEQRKKREGIRQAPAICNPDTLEKMELDDLQSYTDTCGGYVRELREACDYRQAARWLIRCADAESVLVRRSSGQLFREPLYNYINAGRLFNDLLDPEAAFSCFQKAEERINQINSSRYEAVWSEEDEDWLEPIVSHFGDDIVAEVQELLGDTASLMADMSGLTLYHYEKALAAVRRLADKDPSTYCGYAAMLCYKCAAASEKREETCTYFEDALDYGKRHLKQSGGEYAQLFIRVVEQELRMWGVGAPSEKPSKRIAVVFYSLDGNTRLAANELAKRAGADVFEIRAVKPYPAKGPLKILLGGKDATFDRCPKIELLDFDLSAYDSIAIGTPVWADKVAAPMNTFLKEHDFSGKRLALFVSSASGEAEKCLRDLAAKCAREVERVPVLSLKEPVKMDKAELSAQIDEFAKQL